MRYEILLFDLDNTLLDFKANEAQALPRVFRNFGYEYSHDILEVYLKFNNELWGNYEKGMICIDDVLTSRFYKTIKHLGHEIDGREWDVLYRKFLSEGAQLMPYAYDVCKKLSKNYRMFVITNGVTKTQLSRLEKSGLSPFFEKIFTSQSIGVQKPEKEFFDYVKSHIENFDTAKALLIGDSLTTDIKGGFDYGIDTCFYSSECVDSLKPVYKISDLRELYEIL